MCDDSEMFGDGVSPKEIWVYDIHIASFIEGLVDLVKVFTYDVIVELLGSPDIEGESSYFAADFTLLGLATVIFGARRSEFCDEVTIIEFVGHVP